MCSELNVKSPFAGMSWGQRIMTVALLALLLIAGVAFLGHQTDTTSSASPSPSGFSAQTYTSSGGTETSTTDGNSSPRGGTKSGAGATNRATPKPTDGLDAVAYAQLPGEAKKTINLIDEGGPFPYARDGVVFSNVERILPKHPRGWYHEYTVKTPGASNRGARRVIVGQDGTMYYTSDHYQSFKRVQR